MDLTAVNGTWIRRLTREDAEAFAAYKLILARYQLADVLRCLQCAEAGRRDGCRSTVSDRIVRIECRCGDVEYRLPIGESWGLSTAAVPKGAEAVRGHFVLESGQSVDLPVQVLARQEARVIEAYRRVCHEQRYDPRVIHWRCWNGSPTDANTAEWTDGESDLHLMCACRVLVSTLR